MRRWVQNCKAGTESRLSSHRGGNIGFARQGKAERGEERARSNPVSTSYQRWAERKKANQDDVEDNASDLCKSMRNA